MCTILHLKTSKWKSGWQNVFGFFPTCLVSVPCLSFFFCLLKAAYLLNPLLLAPQWPFHCHLFQKKPSQIEITRALHWSYGFIIVNFTFFDLSVAICSWITFHLRRLCSRWLWLPCPIFHFDIHFLIWWFLFTLESFHTYRGSSLSCNPTASSIPIKYIVQVVSWHANQSHTPEAGYNESCTICIHVTHLRLQVALQFHRNGAFTGNRLVTSILTIWKGSEDYKLKCALH